MGVRQTASVAVVAACSSVFIAVGAAPQTVTASGGHVHPAAFNFASPGGEPNSRAVSQTDSRAVSRAVDQENSRAVSRAVSQNDSRAVSRSVGSNLPCQSKNYQHVCYGPDQIRAAYQIQPLLDAGVNGRGKTIVIIDAYQNPTMASDLQEFDAQFGLAAPPSFRTVAPFGLTPFDPSNSNQVSWSGEIALDVEWAHSVAPDAKIVLALAPSDSDPDIVATQNWVINNNLGDVISMSYGDSEQCMSPAVVQEQHQGFAKAASRGVTLVAGSGDWGAGVYSCDGSTLSQGVLTPASDPYVTAVGGTQLKADLNTGEYQSETAWNEKDAGATGGGYSSLYSAPSYQRGVTGSSARALPDVAYSSAYDGGVLVDWGSSGYAPDPVWGNFWIFYGTSAGTPQWAGLAALTDQLHGSDVGSWNAQLYRLAGDFHDVTNGNNDWSGIRGYRAGKGWDATTGLGSPVASDLVPALADK